MDVAWRQAFTLGDFAAPMSLSAITSLLGALMTLIAQLLEAHSFDIGWPLISFGNLLSYSFLVYIIPLFLIIIFMKSVYKRVIYRKHWNLALKGTEK